MITRPLSGSEAHWASLAERDQLVTDELAARLLTWLAYRRNVCSTEHTVSAEYGQPGEADAPYSSAPGVNLRPADYQLGVTSDNHVYRMDLQVLHRLSLEHLFLFWMVSMSAYSRSGGNGQLSNVELRFALGAGERTSVTMRNPGEPC